MRSELVYTAFVAALILERGFELRLSRRNAERALARGGVEVGQGHFRWMKILHTGFFAGCLLEVWLGNARFDARLAVAMSAVALVAQALRYWAIGTLGPRWNVAVIVEPGLEAVRSGPYRFIRHPNYLAVVLEGVAVPLIHGAWLTAFVFTVLDGWLLWVRIRVEERALSEHSSYRDVFRGVGRFLPGS